MIFLGSWAWRGPGGAAVFPRPSRRFMGARWLVFEKHNISFARNNITCLNYGDTLSAFRVWQQQKYIHYGEVPTLASIFTEFDIFYGAPLITRCLNGIYFKLDSFSEDRLAGCIIVYRIHVWSFIIYFTIVTTTMEIPRVYVFYLFMAPQAFRYIYWIFNNFLSEEKTTLN